MEKKDKPTQPKKKKTLTKEKTSPPIIVKKFDENTLTSDQIRRLLKEVMVESAYEAKMKDHLEIEAMASTIEEFLRSFIVIGYDMKNEPVVITSAKSQLDADALYTALARVFISTNTSGGL
jgi:hypothetical protein